MSTYAIHSRTKNGQADVATARTGCGCKDEPEPPPCDCTLGCFERPQYFCGHLLSSEDLSLQLRYDVEKNKLRNRALHGHGVVCGLRLTCDPDCDGAVVVSTGYAIDDCGNDLVVCEPTRFKVVKRLREKQLIEGPPPDPDDCVKTEETDDDECPELRCFYIVACYAEEPHAFEAPFQAGCNPKPADCLPTRVRETVSFDVVARLPKRAKPGGTSCLAALEESELVAELRKNFQPLAGILDESAKGEREFDYCDLFCRLKKLFRRVVKAYPPGYTCDLAAQIDALTCPDEKDTEGPRTEMRQAFCDLLNLVFTYGIECALDGLVFSCPDPCEAGCVVLGAVYVENGVLKRVCNTPRAYVWSFANLWNILQIELAAIALREAEKRGTIETDRRTVRCCPEYRLDCIEFLKALSLSKRSMSESVGAFPSAMEAFIRTTALAFNFTDAASVAPGLYSGSRETIDSLRLNVLRAETVENVAAAPTGDMFSAFLSHALIQPGTPVVTLRPAEGDQVRIVRQPTFGLDVVKAQIDPERIASLERDLTASRETIQTLNKTIADLSERVDGLAKGRGGKPAGGKGENQ